MASDLPAAVLEVPITARTDVPDDATAAVYNLTSDGATGPGYATSFPCDVAQPLVSNLNFRAGRPAANATITGLAADGTVCVFNSASTHLIVDLIGYTRGTAHYVPVTPVARPRHTRVVGHRVRRRDRADLAPVGFHGVRRAPRRVR